MAKNAKITMPTTDQHIGDHDLEYNDGTPDIDDEQDLDEGEQPLYELHRVEADDHQSLMRVDKFLMEHLANTSRNRIQNAKRLPKQRNGLKSSLFPKGLRSTESSIRISSSGTR